MNYNLYLFWGIQLDITNPFISNLFFPTNPENISAFSSADQTISSYRIQCVIYYYFRG